MDDTTRQLSQLYRRTTRPQDACPSSQRLAALAEGSVWPWQRNKLSRHLSTCPHCAAEMQSLLAVRDGLHDALGVARPGERSRFGWTLAFGTAGACAAALAVVLLLPQSHENAAPGNTGADLLFASDFAPASSTKSDDTLFRGDFDGGAAETLFQSDFDPRS